MTRCEVERTEAIVIDSCDDAPKKKRKAPRAMASMKGKRHQRKAKACLAFNSLSEVPGKERKEPVTSRKRRELNSLKCLTSNRLSFFTSSIAFNAASMTSARLCRIFSSGYQRRELEACARFRFEFRRESRFPPCMRDALSFTSPTARLAAGSPSAESDTFLWSATSPASSAVLSFSSLVRREDCRWGEQCIEERNDFAVATFLLI
mmetsp:Transcript_47322/g.122405  ORF Transcript_47322/g.122405 Transcript_47322/m.122405 type:complete len:206 (+) Transcript_47322:2051-2668(+)